MSGPTGVSAMTVTATQQQAAAAIPYIVRTRAPTAKTHLDLLDHGLLLEERAHGGERRGGRRVEDPGGAGPGGEEDGGHVPLHGEIQRGVAQAAGVDLHVGHGV